MKSEERKVELPRLQFGCHNWDDQAENTANQEGKPDVAAVLSGKGQVPVGREHSREKGAEHKEGEKEENGRRKLFPNVSQIEAEHCKNQHHYEKNHRQNHKKQTFAYLDVVIVVGYKQRKNHSKKDNVKNCKVVFLK